MPDRSGRFDSIRSECEAESHDGFRCTGDAVSGEGTHEAALAVLYRRMPWTLRDRLIAGVLEEASRGEVDLSGLGSPARRGRIVGVLLTQALAGNAAAVWAPEVKSTWRRSSLAAALLRRPWPTSAPRFRIAQALLDESAPRQAGPTCPGAACLAFTELISLERDTATPLLPSRSTIAGL